MTTPESSSPGQGVGAAFFDLDKTIIAKTAVAAFRGPLYQDGLLTRRSVARTVLAQVVYLHLGASERRLGTLRESLLRLAAGWDRDHVARIVEEALEATVEPIIYAEALELIDAHHDQGREVVIVSAAPEEVVVPLGRHLGVDHTIASRAEVDGNGRYTGEMAFYCYGTYKAEAVVGFCAEHGISMERCYAYSDSYTDVPMLRTVGHPFAVNPDRVLARFAREHDWELLNFVRPVRLRDRVRVYVTQPYRLPAVAASTAIGLTAAGVAWWIESRRGHRDGPAEVLKAEAR